MPHRPSSMPLPAFSPFGQAIVAEAVGTFALVFAAVGSMVVDARTGALGHLGVALAPGLMVAAMIAAIGHISGAHINPAVTVAFWLRRHFPGRHVLPYVAAQIAGAGAAALAVRASLGDEAGIGATVPSGSSGQSFVWELIFTAVLVFVVLAVATDPRAALHPAALVIGATVALAALVGGPVSGASLNPARSLGPVIAGGPTSGLWVYLTAPFLAAVLATALHLALRPTPHGTAAS